MSAAASGTLWEDDDDDDDSVSEQESVQSSFKYQRAEEFTLAQLEAATKGFALEAKIGEGSFGALYHGKLPDGREVAIKRDGSGRRARWFQESALELAFRSHLDHKHKHLVGLVGYCEVNEELLLLVYDYEYAQNGALCDHLHRKATATPAPASPPSPVVSSWKLRIKILLDASRGIEYLHSFPGLPKIHGDVKSSNILLDAGWTARVSDFGLPLTDPEEQTAAHLTKKTDVYGFGLVMLEALTGIFNDEADGGVVDYAIPSIIAGELGKVLDPRAPEPAAHEAEAVGLVAYTAVHCVCLEGKDRPAMAAIVASLETALSLCEGDSGGGGFGSSAGL
ncbi:putative serine/threonine-protein kinase-like protein CCR3 [Panicum virgatum]|nr:putative serine/threonine-protein kinase-like protein CCR3 [Panicum virgatum]